MHSHPLTTYCDNLIERQLDERSSIIRLGPLAKRLNEESLGDCADAHRAGAPTGLSPVSRSQAKPLIDYRKEASHD